jgi:hypothetical protein
LLVNSNLNVFPRQTTHLSVAKNEHATIKELLEVVLPMCPLPRLYSVGEWGPLVSWSGMVRS